MPHVLHRVSIESSSSPFAGALGNSRILIALVCIRKIDWPQLSKRGISTVVDTFGDLINSQDNTAFILHIKVSSPPARQFER